LTNTQYCKHREQQYYGYYVMVRSLDNHTPRVNIDLATMQNCSTTNSYIKRNACFCNL